MPMSERSALSVVIIAKNSASVFEACLASVAFADEILVVDSGSTDETLTIAKRFGARIVHREWAGYGAQKQFAVEHATHDWVFCIDTDERVSEELGLNILSEMFAPKYKAYQMPRCNRFMGRWLRHGEGYPDHNLRLFHRAHARWSDDTVHEHVLASGDIGCLRGDLQHESEATLAQYLEKQNRYTTLQADNLVQLDRSKLVFKMLSSPIVRFIKFYFLRRGFLDGVPGLVHITIGCINSFMKYAKAIERDRPN